MNFIAHRINTIKELNATDPIFGVEVDIRSQGDQLIINHDPFVSGESFNDWLSHYRHSTLILNVKEEGLEEHLIKLMSMHGIDDFFFLDQSFPFLLRWADLAKGRSAVRISEFESVETALNIADKVSWVWLDYFTRFPIDIKQANLLKSAGLNLCLVSPELHGFDLTRINVVAEEILIGDFEIDAICTKKPEIWKALLG